jgi:hypothetical protein
VFFRHRGADGEAHLGELVHQTAMYYQDRLGGGGFGRVMVGGSTPESLNGPVWAGIQARLGVGAEVVQAGGGAAVDPARLDAVPPAFGLAASLRDEG